MNLGFILTEFLKLQAPFFSKKYERNKPLFSDLLTLFNNQYVVDYDQNILHHKTAQHSVHPTGGSLRVFKQFSWLEVGSVKMALSRPTHQRVTQAVGTLLA